MTAPKVIKNTAPPLEKKVESRLKKKLGELGIKSYKFTSPAKRSVSDQIVWLNGVTLYVEVKRDKSHGTWSAKQKLFAEDCAEHGMHYIVVWGYAGVDKFVKECDNFNPFPVNEGEIKHYE